jgi:hypothetical protein
VQSGHEHDGLALPGRRGEELAGTGALHPTRCLQGYRGAATPPAYRLNYQRLGPNHGDGVDFRLRQTQVILCPQTAEFLYSHFTPTTARYRKGSRPLLERLVGDTSTRT